MTENVENLILEHLKRIQGEQAATRSQLADVLTRLGQIETMVGRLLRDNADAYGERIEDRHSLDALRSRVERLERRLELEP
ncbi:MAG: hypothetical protein QM676_14445 [Novosphingobium sp.]